MVISRKYLLGVAAASILAVAGAYGLSESSSQASQPVDAKIVAVVPVKRSDLARDIVFSAELRPFEEADLHAKVAGYLRTIHVDIGDRVKRGEVLATLDVDELRDDLQNADASFHDAELNYQRIREVVNQRPGLLAQGDVDKAQAAYEMAKARKQRAVTMVGYATINAPFDGIVTKRYADPGALIQAGTNSNSQAMPVVHIAETATLRLAFPVPESIVPQVKVGTPVEVTVGTTRQKLDGKISRLAGKLDIATRTMEAEVDLKNDGQMAPGMYASARVVLERKASVLTLPIEAVSGDGAAATVWAVGGDGAVAERHVVLGLRTDRQVEVVSGVAEGDVVVYGSRTAIALGSHVKTKQIAQE